MANKGLTTEQVKASRKNIGHKRRERMEAFLGLRRQGLTVEDAVAKIGVSKSAYKQWRKDSDWFRREADRISMQLAKKAPGEERRCPFTAETREKYFHEAYDEPVNPKHLRLAMAFIRSLEPGEFGLMLFPPDHAKTSIAEDWISCAIADDPETRSGIVSKTRPDASIRTAHIRDRMMDRDFFADWIDDFGPFESEGRGKPWSTVQLSVFKKSVKQRDPNIQSLGIGSQVQGKRLDLALVDDAADDKNAHEYVKQATYIRQSVNSRLGNYGIGLMIGTRQAEMDLYRYLQDEGFFDKILKLPAVFEERTEYTFDGETFVFEAGEYLWPERFSPEDYARMERKAGPRIWALTYQQKDEVTEGVKFPLALFENCYNPKLRAKEVPENSIVVAGLDPSASNYTSAFVLAVNRQTELRTWVDVLNEKGLVGDGGDIVRGLVQFIFEVVDAYDVRFLGLERNSTFVLLSTNLELKIGLSKRNCKLIPLESTGTGLRTANQEIEDMSIEQMSTHFANGTHQIPTGPMADGSSSKELFMKAIRQFMAWRPKTRHLVRDMVKSCQMAEAAARRAVTEGISASQPYFGQDKLPPYLQKRQNVDALSPSGGPLKVADILGRAVSR